MNEFLPFPNISIIFFCCTQRGNRSHFISYYRRSLHSVYRYGEKTLPIFTQNLILFSGNKVFRFANIIPKLNYFKSHLTWHHNLTQIVYRLAIDTRFFLLSSSCPPLKTPAQTIVYDIHNDNGDSAAAVVPLVEYSIRRAHSTQTISAMPIAINHITKLTFIL